MAMSGPSPWSQIVAPAVPPSFNSPPPPPPTVVDSTVANNSPPPEDSDSGSRNNVSTGKRPGWNKPSNGLSSSVMGATESWPLPSESARAPAKSLSLSPLESAKALIDASSVPPPLQGSGSMAPSPQRSVRDNNASANNNYTNNNTVQTHQKSYKRGNSNTSSNGGHLPPQMSGPQGPMAPAGSHNNNSSPSINLELDLFLMITHRNEILGTRMAVVHISTEMVIIITMGAGTIKTVEIKTGIITGILMVETASCPRDLVRGTTNLEKSDLELALKALKDRLMTKNVCLAPDKMFEGREPQDTKICSVVRRAWKAYQSNMKSLILKVPSSQRQVYFSWTEVDSREPRNPNKAIISSREISSNSTASDDRRFVRHSITFSKIWSSEQEYNSRCSLCSRKQVSQNGRICSIWRPVCPDGYIYIGDIARVGIHPPNVAAVYRKIEGLFALPMGYDLVWRNCQEDYVTPVSIWHPRAPDGFVAPGCVAVAGYMEPEPDLVYCIAESLIEETEFEESKVWSAPDSYPWTCHIYPVQSDALHFVALRESKEESEWKPKRVHDDPHSQLQSPSP